MKWHLRVIAALAIASLICDSAEANKKVPPPTSGPEGLRYAAANCDLPMVKSLIASGTTVSAPDAEGFDALSRASLSRQEVLFPGWGFKKPRATDAMTLTCPSVVAALTDAGADPWKGKFYQNPMLDEHRPKVIAVISIVDNREIKGDSEKLLEGLKDGVEMQLSGSSEKPNVHLGYPIVRLTEVRQKLLAAGFSAEDAMAPDRVKVCKALGVDSVFEASLEGYKNSNALIMSASAMRIKFVLTDCTSNALLFRSDMDYKLAEGVLARGFGGN